MRMDISAPERTTTKSVEGALESAEAHVLDDSGTGAGPGLGGQAMFRCEGDPG